MAQDSISFIPKTVMPKPAYQQRSFGFLVSISLVVLIVSAGVLAGAYLYSGLLNSDIVKLRADLDKIKNKNEFEVASIRNFSEMAASIDLAKTVVNSHVAVSKVLKLVQDNVLPTTRFTDFNYEGDKNDHLTMNGETASFTSLADQARVFGGNKYVRSLTISDISLRKSGNVGFSIMIVIDPALISFVGDQQN
jgi:hypothetical protein